LNEDLTTVLSIAFISLDSSLLTVHAFHVNLKTFLAGKGIAAHLANEVPDLLVNRLVVLNQSPLGGEPVSADAAGIVTGLELIMLPSYVPLQVAQLSGFVGTLPAGVLDSQVSMLLVKDQSLRCCKGVVGAPFLFTDEFLVRLLVRQRQHQKFLLAFWLRGGFSSCY